MTTYTEQVTQAQQQLDASGVMSDGISAENVTRMRLQNRFNTGLDIAKYTAKIMREDMEAMAAVKLSDVEEVQFEVVQVARRLEEEGKIIINSGGESAYV